MVDGDAADAGAGIPADGALEAPLAGEYATSKVAELQQLLRERGLHVSGRKAELIARLEEHDAQQEDSEDEQEWEVEAVLDVREVDGVREFLVSWVGFGEEEDGWEPEENLAGARELLDDVMSQRAEDAQEEEEERMDREEEEEEEGEA